jgi:CRISPR system Cascade subunit CasE
VIERLWLSRLVLNARHKDAAKALQDAHSLHALTMRCLPPDTRRAEANLLHRVDLRTGVLVVQSCIRPQWPSTTAFHAQTKEITAFVTTLAQGDKLRFSVRTVPIRRQSAKLRDGTAMRAPGEHAVRTDADRIAWLERRVGAAVIFAAPPCVSVEPDRIGYREGQRFGHRPIVFDGIVEVIDADALRALMIKGVGRARSYGNGLLMLGSLPHG